MALIPCPECQQKVSTAATACPHCGYPLQPTPGEAPVYIGHDESNRYGGQTCYACNSHADRACTRCGQLCCGEHSTWFHPIKHAGLVCTSCASWHWIFSLIAFAVVGGIILVVLMGGFR
jgi:hypothetical protein